MDRAYDEGNTLNLNGSLVRCKGRVGVMFLFSWNMCPLSTLDLYLVLGPNTLPVRVLANVVEEPRESQ